MTSSLKHKIEIWDFGRGRGGESKARRLKKKPKNDKFPQRRPPERKAYPYAFPPPFPWPSPCPCPCLKARIRRKRKKEKGPFPKLICLKSKKKNLRLAVGPTALQSLLFTFQKKKKNFFSFKPVHMRGCIKLAMSKLHTCRSVH